MTNKLSLMVVAGMSALVSAAGCVSDEPGVDPDPAGEATATADIQAPLALSGYHQIINKAYNQCLDAPRAQLNEVLQLSSCNGSSTQYWQFLPVTGQGSTTFNLQNLWTSLDVEVNNGTSNPGELVDEWTPNGLFSEAWVQGFRSVGGVAYSSFTHLGTGLCLDTVGGAGSQIMQWTCAGNDAQTWLVR